MLPKQAPQPAAINDTRPWSESTLSENAWWVGDGAHWVRTSGDEGSDHDLSLDKDLGVSKARAPTNLIKSDGIIFTSFLTALTFLWLSSVPELLLLKGSYLQMISVMLP